MMLYNNHASKDGLDCLDVNPDVNKDSKNGHWFSLDGHNALTQSQNGC